MNEGIERIKILSAEIEDENLKKITDYLISRKDMNEKYLNEEKSIKQMVTYINNYARQLLSKKAKSGFVGKWFNDEEVLGWAIHYWDESNEDLKIKTVEESKISETIEKEEKEESKTNSKKKNWVPEGQLSLFDM